jgi:hypothetical protein
MILRPVCSERVDELPPPTVVTQAVEEGLQEQAEKAVIEAAATSASLNEHFASLKDLRKSGLVEHKLIDIITITVCAVICGANNCEVPVSLRDKE